MVTDYNLPPHNIEAEKWVISWALMDNETVWIFEWDGIVPGDFYQKEHGMIYEAIAQLWNQKKTIDVVTVSDQLSKNWNLESVWWSDYLYELSAFLISTSPCVEYSKIVKEKSFILALLGIILLAAAVNIIELLCSLGLPVMFSEILAINGVSNTQKIIYSLIYVFFFLIDDIIVFIIAMKTMEIRVVSNKFGKYSHLIGGLIMLIIGFLMLYRPEWLMFNF